MLFAATCFASTLTGVVTNRTTGKPSAGDTVAVIDTAKSMEELAKVTSDAQGKFHVNAPDGGQTLLHVTHRGAEYFKSVPPGTRDMQIDVFDSATKVDGINAQALVLRAETDAGGKSLNMVESFFVQNATTPPRTEYGGNTVDFYLPKGAVIVQSQANSPSGMPTNTDVKVIDEASGHYAFTFPVRPGSSLFQVAYSLPYNGKQAFSLKLSMPTGDVAVMLPKTMQFQGSPQFQPLNQETTAQSYDLHQPAVAQPVEFSIAGTGQLPQAKEEAQSGSQGMGAQTAGNGSRPGGGLGAPDDPGGKSDPWAQYKWWVLGLLGAALVIGAGLMLKAGQSVPAVAEEDATPAFAATNTALPVTTAPAKPNATPSSGILLQALRDELFVLETDRLAGRLSEDDYAKQKAAFDIVLRRAMNRTEAAPSASN